MELRQLEYFIVVAEELHFGHAATRLQMTQPPLSQQILQLERELGVTLLKRSKRHVELTSAGKLFLQEVRLVFTQLERAKDIAQKAEGGMVGRLVVGFVGSAIFDILPIIVRDFQEQYPSVDLVFHEMPTPVQMKALHNKEIDIGFIRPPVIDPHISHWSVYQETCIAVVPRLHPLANRASISIENLNAERFILVEREIWPSWYDDILSKCRDAGFNPIIHQHVKEIQTVVGLVAAGVCVSIIPRSTVNLHVKDVVYIDIEGNVPHVEMSLAWRTHDHSILVKQFLDTAIELTGRNVK